MHGRRTERGFTLIELLVVIAIIGVLSTIAVIAVLQARDKAKLARAQGDVKQLATAVELLGADTGKWPNGCPIESVANPEVDLDTQQAGITEKPAVGDQGGGCSWTAEDIAKWNGPYMQTIADPWGDHYWFDPDFTPYLHCATQTPLAETVVVESFGPDKNGLNSYDCDDIWYAMR